MTELLLSQVGAKTGCGGVPSALSITGVASARIAGVVALASAGIPSTIATLSTPYANSETLKLARFVICGGAVHAVGGPVGVGTRVGGLVTMLVIVAGIAVSVTITGGGTTVSTIVTTSVVVLVETTDGVLLDTGVGGAAGATSATVGEGPAAVTTTMVDATTCTADVTT